MERRKVVDLRQYDTPEDFLRDFIPYVEQTSEESWCTDVVRSGDTNCLFGHLANFVGPKDNIGPDFEWFEGAVSTTYVVYPINDGTDPDYPQGTPKQRCLAYLRDLLSGKQLTTIPGMEAEYERWKDANPDKFRNFPSVELRIPDSNN